MLTPFSFWRFNRLAYGAMFAVLSIVVAEAFQGLSAGHRTSYLELVAKLLVLFTGFAFALELRLDRRIKLGPLSVVLFDPITRSRLMADPHA